jgi:hypothetical protein
MSQNKHSALAANSTPVKEKLTSHEKNTSRLFAGDVSKISVENSRNTRIAFIQARGFAVKV